MAVDFRVSEYYDTHIAETRLECILVLNEEKTFEIVWRDQAIHSRTLKSADISSITCGKNTGFLCIWLKSDVLGPQPHQLLFDIVPDTCAPKAAKIIREWLDLSQVAAVYCSKSEKEQLMGSFRLSLKTEEQQSEVSTNVSNEKILQVIKKTSEKAISPVNSKDQTISASETAETQLTPSSFSVSDSSNSVAKRRKLDELDSFYDPLIEDLQGWKDRVVEARHFNESQVAEIDRLTSENNRLQQELDAERKKKDSSSSTKQVNHLKVKMHEVNIKANGLTKKLHDAREQNRKLSKETELLQGSKDRMASELNSKKASVTSLSAEKIQLAKKLAVSQKDESRLKSENEALKDLAGMFVSAVDMEKFLGEVGRGGDFDEALRVSMRKRSQT